ncbi:MAG: hypothetical protein GY703_24540 [Gammaproteobacteria bacterium]|nr:hypothetical protein [Gammaproteobacteria bacterium]
MSKKNAALTTTYLPISTLTIPPHWSAEQAMVVWEFLDEVARCVWDRYELPLVEQIQAELYQESSNQLDLFDPNDDLPDF